jgi:hypothetical protein
VTPPYIAIDLISGTTYKFKVVARNAHDYGDFSGEIEVLAAQMPDQPAQPTIILDGDNVVVDWAAPYD